MPRAEEATGPRDATELGIAVRCGGVGCWWLVGARRPPPPPHGGRASIGRGGEWASEATVQLRAKGSTEHAGAFGQRRARSTAAARRRAKAVDTRSREEGRQSSTGLSLSLYSSAFPLPSLILSLSDLGF